MPNSGSREGALFVCMKTPSWPQASGARDLQHLGGEALVVVLRDWADFDGATCQDAAEDCPGPGRDCGVAVAEGRRMPKAEGLRNPGERYAKAQALLNHEPSSSAVSTAGEVHGSTALLLTGITPHAMKL